MIKLGTIGMIEKNAKSFPQVKAHADIINGYFCTITNTATAAPTADTAKTKDVCVVLNTALGDNQYKDFTIKAGENANAFLIKEWDGQTLVMNDVHLTTAYASVSEGDDLVIDTNGKLAKTAVTGYAVYFKVIKKFNFCGNGLEVKIVVA